MKKIVNELTLVFSRSVDTVQRALLLRYCLLLLNISFISTDRKCASVVFEFCWILPNKERIADMFPCITGHESICTVRPEDIIQNWERR